MALTWTFVAEERDNRFTVELDPRLIVRTDKTSTSALPRDPVLQVYPCISNSKRHLPRSYLCRCSFEVKEHYWLCPSAVCLGVDQSRPVLFVESHGLLLGVQHHEPTSYSRCDGVSRKPQTKIDKCAPQPSSPIPSIDGKAGDLDCWETFILEFCLTHVGRRFPSIHLNLAANQCHIATSLSELKTP